LFSSSSGPACRKCPTVRPVTCVVMELSGSQVRLGHTGCYRDKHTRVEVPCFRQTRCLREASSAAAQASNVSHAVWCQNHGHDAPLHLRLGGHCCLGAHVVNELLRSGCSFVRFSDTANAWSRAEKKKGRVHVKGAECWQVGGLQQRTWNRSRPMSCISISRPRN